MFKLKDGFHRFTLTEIPYNGTKCILVSIADVSLKVKYDELFEYLGNQVKTRANSDQVKAPYKILLTTSKQDELLS